MGIYQVITLVGKRKLMEIYVPGINIDWYVSQWLYVRVPGAAASPFPHWFPVEITDVPSEAMAHPQENNIYKLSRIDPQSTVLYSECNAQTRTKYFSTPDVIHAEETHKSNPFLGSLTHA